MDLERLLNPAYYCQKCLRSFKNKCSLTRHEKNVHAGVLICNFCQNKLKAMGRPDAFKAHLKRCKAFNDKFNLDDERLMTKLLEDTTMNTQIRSI